MIETIEITKEIATISEALGLTPGTYVPILEYVSREAIPIILEMLDQSTDIDTKIARLREYDQAGAINPTDYVFIGLFIAIQKVARKNDLPVSQVALSLFDTVNIAKEQYEEGFQSNPEKIRSRNTKLTGIITRVGKEFFPIKLKRWVGNAVNSTEIRHIVSAIGDAKLSRPLQGLIYLDIIDTLAVAQMREHIDYLLKNEFIARYNPDDGTKDIDSVWKVRIIGYKNTPGILYCYRYHLRASREVSRRSKEMFGEEMTQRAINIWRFVINLTAKMTHNMETLSNLRVPILKQLNRGQIEKALKEVETTVTRFPDAAAICQPHK
jgi:hypothetical protein